MIVTTIHQPSSRMFPMFDKLILLSEGHPLYFGLAKDALDYFATQQFIPLLPMNPADFLIDLATGLTSDMTVPPELQQKIFMSGSSPVTKANGLQESEAVASSVQEANVTTHASVDSSPDSSNEETQRLLVVKAIHLTLASFSCDPDRGKTFRILEIGWLIVNFSSFSKAIVASIG